MARRTFGKAGANHHHVGHMLGILFCVMQGHGPVPGAPHDHHALQAQGLTHLLEVAGKRVEITSRGVLRARWRCKAAIVHAHRLQMLA